MDHLISRAELLFPGSRQVFSDDYEQARERLLGFSRSLQGILPPEERWALNVLACWDVVALQEEPYPTWAMRLLETDLKQVLEKLHSLETAIDFPTIYPDTWRRRPRLAILRRLPPAEQALLRHIMEKEEKAIRDYHAKLQPFGNPEAF